MKASGWVWVTLSGVASLGMTQANEEVRISHDAVGCVVAEQYPELVAQLEPASAVAQARVHFRPRGGEHWYSVPLEAAADGFHGVLPRPRKGLEGLDYYISVIDSRMGTARTAEYQPRVASGPAACSEGKVAAVLAKATVTVLLPPGALALPLVPPGFSAVGVVAGGAAGAASAAGGAVAGTGTAGSGAAGGAGTAGSGAAGGAGAGAAGAAAGGLSTGVIVGGVAAAAAVAGVAAGGGGGDGDSGTGAGGGSTTPTTTTPPVNLTGRWQGPFVQNFSGTFEGFAVSGSCNQEVALDLNHSGSNITGTGRGVSGTCSVNAPGFAEIFQTSSDPGPWNGTASNGRVTFNFPGVNQEGVSCAGVSLQGTYTSNTIQGPIAHNYSCTFEGTSFTLSVNGSFTFRR